MNLTFRLVQTQVSLPTGSDGDPGVRNKVPSGSSCESSLCVRKRTEPLRGGFMF